MRLDRGADRNNLDTHVPAGAPEAQSDQSSAAVLGYMTVGSELARVFLYGRPKQSRTAENIEYAYLGRRT